MYKQRRAHHGSLPVWAQPKSKEKRFPSCLAVRAFLFTSTVLLGLSGVGSGLAFPRSEYRPGNNTLKPLAFNSSGLFQLSIFEDLHFGEGMSDSPVACVFH